MAGISIFALAFALLLGADEVTGLDANEMVVFQEPSSQVVIVAVRLRQTDDRVSTSEAEQRELEKVTGTWVQTGEAVPPENARARLIYTGREFVGRIGDKVPYRGSVKLDPTQHPKAIDLTLDTGPNKGKVSLGVYELDAADYRGCLVAPGKPRPNRLSPEPASGQQAFSFRRAKEEKSNNSRPTLKTSDAAKIQAELDRFEGTWSFASVIRDGRPVAEGILKSSRLVLKGDRFTLTEATEIHQGKFDVNPSATPSTLDVTFTEGSRAGKSRRGIYKLDGDACDVCFSTDDQLRPTTFDSKPGSHLVHEVLKRATR
jgi:uncharacterized protein (TIGR03067 family)